MLKKNVQDLAKGVRNAQNIQQYIAEQLVDIHEECKSRKKGDKVNAIQKLTFLNLVGCDIKQYAFHTIECMSSTEIQVKRAGYLASNFSFGSPDMQTLSTN